MRVEMSEAEVVRIAQQLAPSETFGGKSRTA
jgi:hypothetical protein